MVCFVRLFIFFVVKVVCFVVKIELLVGLVDKLGWEILFVFNCFFSVLFLSVFGLFDNCLLKNIIVKKILRMRRVIIKIICVLC